MEINEITYYVYMNICNCIIGVSGVYISLFMLLYPWDY